MSKKLKLIPSLSRISALGARKIGLLGGSFDPVHAGHIQLADSCCKHLGLDMVIFIPAKQNPLKELVPGAASKQRLAMLCAALKEHPKYFASDIEIKRSDKSESYTVDTLRDILHANPGASLELYLLLGSDAIVAFNSWKDYRELSELSQIVFHTRGNLTETEVEEAKEDLARLDLVKPAILLVGDTQGVSSTQVRERIAQGDLKDPWILPEVAQYVKRHRLYSAQLTMIQANLI